MLLVTLAVAASVVAPVAATAAADDKTILLIYADARLIPAIVTADQAIRDAKRASEVVRHLRALFRKEHVDQQPLDLNDVIREITRLLGKDLERKRISYAVFCLKKKTRLSAVSLVYNRLRYSVTVTLHASNRTLVSYASR